MKRRTMLRDSETKKVRLTRRTLAGTDVMYSQAFSEANALVEETGQLVPYSLYFLLNGRLPGNAESIEVVRDGGRTAILPRQHSLNGNEVVVRLKGIGYDVQNAQTAFKPENAMVAERLKDYLIIRDKSKDPSLALFITSLPGSITCGGMRPMGGQSRKLAEWDLDFSNRLSKKFRYKGAYFTPTVAVIGYDSQAKAVIGNLNRDRVKYTVTRSQRNGKEITVTKKKNLGRETFPLEDIVQEYQLFPSNLTLNKFLNMPDERLQQTMQQAGRARFRRNFLSSLYHLAVFPMNTLVKETLEFLTLNPPIDGNLATESVIALDGKVYWKDLDNMAIAYTFRQAFTKGKASKKAVKQRVAEDTAEYVATALCCTLGLFNRKTGSKLGDLGEAKAALDEFVAVMGKARGTKFTNYRMSEKTTDNPYWRTFQVELSYSNRALGNGALKLHYNMPVTPDKEPEGWRSLASNNKAYFTSLST